MCLKLLFFSRKILEIKRLKIWPHDIVCKNECIMYVCMDMYGTYIYVDLKTTETINSRFAHIFFETIHCKSLHSEFEKKMWYVIRGAHKSIELCGK